MTVTDRRLRPRCCHLGSYFKRPKSSPVRPLACNWYYCAQSIAKPNAACALRFSWVTTSSNLSANMMSSIKPEMHNISEQDPATATGNMHKKIGEDRTCSSDDMIDDRQTYTHRQTNTLITLFQFFIGGGIIKVGDWQSRKK